MTNTETILLFFTDHLPRASTQAAREAVTPDYVDHGASPGAPSGADGIEHLIRDMHERHAPFHFEIHGLIEEGDLVAVRWTLHATDRAGMLGPPTLLPFESRGMAWFRLAGGKVAERWAVIDRLGAIESLRASVAAGVRP